MSRHVLKYGDGQCFLDVPDGCLAAEVLPNAVDLPSLPPAEVVRRALREPVDSPALEAVVKPGEKVCIVIPDISRLWQSPQVYVPEVVAAMDLSRILLETDCPYLPPVPYRGQRNESSYLTYICEKVAEAKGISAEKLAEATTANARCIFGF